MEKKVFSVKTAVAIVIGAALMFGLKVFPSGVEGTYIQPGIAILAAFAAVFGPVAGFLIGLIGHFFIDLTNYLTQVEDQLWWSWILSSGLFGLIVGYFWKMFKKEQYGFDIMQAIIFNGIQIAANALVWVFAARTLDLLIYKEPFGKVSIQGFTAAGINSAVVLVLGTLLVAGYSLIEPKIDS